MIQSPIKIIKFPENVSKPITLLIWSAINAVTVMEDYSSK